MFPLETAVLPGEELPLRIFEPRYRALVADLLSSNDPSFGVVLISRGREVGGGEQRCDVGALATITEHRRLALGRYVLRCRMQERIRVENWLPDDPYPRADARAWPDEPGAPVDEARLCEVEEHITAVVQRIAAARGIRLPEAATPPAPRGTADIGARLYALASRVPIGAADRYAVLAAPSAARRLAALGEAVEAVAAAVQFRFSQ